MSGTEPAAIPKTSAATGSRRSDQSFYTVIALGAALIVFAGFARTYFLRPAFYGLPLSALLHLHGFVTTLWFVVFFLQVRFVAARRVDLHRRLGLAAAFLAPTIFLLGLVALIAVGRRGFSPDRPPAPYFVAMILVSLIVTLVLMVAGLCFRRRGDVHKRLMTLATLSMLTPAIARIPLSVFRSGGFATALAWTDLCIVVCVAYDTMQKRRLHPAFKWGTLFVLAAQPIRFLLAGSDAWKIFVKWLLS
ncbi:MAG TPA: hypothetical protein VKQ28_18210 [Candidatus Acidoferrum sp.]|nr:hypothetical protein [Candidatus Acidoferrum sp.]